jgi:hypothetical protein
MANESGMFIFTREELGQEKNTGAKPDGTAQPDESPKETLNLDFNSPTYYREDGSEYSAKDAKYLFQPRPTLGESIAQMFTGTSQQATSSYSSTQRTPSRSSHNEEQAMEAMQSHVGGWFIGLVLGIIAYRIVRPKAKCSTPMEMARRWMSWGLMGGMTTGTTHFFRYGGAEGIAGGLLGICFFSGAAWFLGFLFGLIKFSLFPKIFSKAPSVPSMKPAEIPALREAAGRGDASSQYQLGMAYFAGEGVVKNHIEAYKWILLAQAGGHADAKKMSAQIEKTLSRQELAEGQKLATEIQGNS